ncbi:hypothetical protein ACFVIX_20905, partial [Bacillus subtilis]
ASAEWVLIARSSAAWKFPRLIQEVDTMEQQSINPYKLGPVEEWKMTPEQLAEYVKKHPFTGRN